MHRKQRFVRGSDDSAETATMHSLNRTLLISLKFLLLFAVTLCRDGFESRWDHYIWSITTEFGERSLRNGSGSFLYFLFVSQRRLDVCLTARHLYF